jgi:hypothetical protein
MTFPRQWRLLPKDASQQPRISDMNRAERDKTQSKTRQKVRLGAGAGYWGAELGAAIKLANEGAIEYLCFDQLAELTMSLLERQRLKNPEHGYIPDIVSQIEQLLPVMRETGVKIITNGGGTNCAAAMDKTLAVAARQGYGDLVVGAVSGDNVTPTWTPARTISLKFAIQSSRLTPISARTESSRR